MQAVRFEGAAFKSEPEAAILPEKIYVGECEELSKNCHFLVNY